MPFEVIISHLQSAAVISSGAVVGTRRWRGRPGGCAGGATEGQKERGKGTQRSWGVRSRWLSHGCPTCDIYTPLHKGVSRNQRSIPLIPDRERAVATALCKNRLTHLLRPCVSVCVCRTSTSIFIRMFEIAVMLSPRQATSVLPRDVSHFSEIFP